jgi:23S rRNA pseudouridine2605 synthase
MERIQKIIANSGHCSRRKAEELIEQGKVELNGELAKLGDKAGEGDKISVEGKEIIRAGEKHYYILNKPKGILVTKEDPQGRRTIYDLESLKTLKKKVGYDLNYVGRLDGMSEGLLILTNDGELSNKLTHPKHHVEKTYQLRTEPTLTKQDIDKLEKGILIDDRKLISKISNIKNNTFQISIKEGRNRIIRKAVEETLHYKIYQLKRISIESLKLSDLPEGEIRELDPKEISPLK